MMERIEKAYFGAGCYWCVEAIFQRVKGVQKVVSGFSGGFIKHPSYKEVCNGNTGHAEVCEITYDANVVSFDELLEVFWKTHDPTTLNRQGGDIGTQYRSAIFYVDETQKVKALFYKEKLDKSGVFQDPIVTEIVPFEVFYSAEPEHQNYFNQHPEQSYCALVIHPKVEKFKTVFAEKLIH